MFRAGQNAAPLNLEIYADIMRHYDISTRYPLDPFSALLCSIQLHFAADRKHLTT